MSSTTDTSMTNTNTGRSEPWEEALLVGPPGAAPGSAAGSAIRLVDEQWLDGLLDRVDADGLALTGPGGFLPELVKAVLERGLQTELTEHLGYEKGDPAG